MGKMTRLLSINIVLGLLFAPSLQTAWAVDKQMRDDSVTLSRNGYPLVGVEDMYISGAKVEPIHIAEWREETPYGSRMRKLVGERAIVHSPESASRYLEKAFVFPTGTVRYLEFSQGNGGMFRRLSDETILYVISGAGAVSVDGEIVPIGTGDVVSRPSGVLEGSGDARVLAWTVSDTFYLDEEPDYASKKAALVPHHEAKITRSAEWLRNGERVVVTGEDVSEAPDNAIQLVLTVYAFDGNVVGVAEGAEGGPTFEYTSPYDQILFVISGSYRFFQEGVEVEVRAGDAVREIAGYYHHWIRHEDSTFAATTTLPIFPYSPEDR